MCTVYKSSTRLHRRIARLAPVYQKLLTELSGPPDLLSKCPHHIPYDKVR
jgi:hypothetical protein